MNPAHGKDGGPMQRNLSGTGSMGSQNGYAMPMQQGGYQVNRQYPGPPPQHGMPPGQAGQQRPPGPPGPHGPPGPPRPHQGQPANYWGGMYGEQPPIGNNSGAGAMRGDLQTGALQKGQSQPLDNQLGVGRMQQMHPQQPQMGYGMAPPPRHDLYGAPPPMAKTTSSVRNDLNKQIKLYEDHRQEQQYKEMADLFSIITATEHLEAAWRRRFIKDEEYQDECWKLINRFKATKEIVKDFVPDIRRFIEEYNMNSNSASRRLLETPMPATVDYGESQQKRSQGESARVGKTVHCFISATDALNLNFIAVDQIMPLLIDILEHLNKLSLIPPDFEGKVKLKAWIAKFHNMRASDNLGEEDVRQLLFDLETSYGAFHRLLAD